MPLTLRRKRLDSISLLNAKLLGAGVAQLVEQKTLNLLVVGSNPSAGTKDLPMVSPTLLAPLLQLKGADDLPEGGFGLFQVFLGALANDEC